MSYPQPRTGGAAGWLLLLVFALMFVGGALVAFSRRGDGAERAAEGPVVQPPMPQPTSPSPSGVEVLPVASACPSGYAQEILEGLRGMGCERRHRREVCRAWVLAIDHIEPECPPGHRRVTVTTRFPFASEEAVETAREIGNRTFIVTLRDSPARVPWVRVNTADGHPLCATFDSPVCATRLGDLLGR